MNSGSETEPRTLAIKGSAPVGVETLGKVATQQRLAVRGFSGELKGLLDPYLTMFQRTANSYHAKGLDVMINPRRRYLLFGPPWSNFRSAAWEYRDNSISGASFNDYSFDLRYRLDYPNIDLESFEMQIRCPSVRDCPPVSLRIDFFDNLIATTDLGWTKDNENALFNLLPGADAQLFILDNTIPRRSSWAPERSEMSTRLAKGPEMLITQYRDYYSEISPARYEFDSTENRFIRRFASPEILRKAVEMGIDQQRVLDTEEFIHILSSTLSLIPTEQRMAPDNRGLRSRIEDGLLRKVLLFFHKRHFRGI